MRKHCLGFSSIRERFSQFNKPEPLIEQIIKRVTIRTLQSREILSVKSVGPSNHKDF